MRQLPEPAEFMFFLLLPIELTGVTVFIWLKKERNIAITERNIAITIREGIMIDTEMGTWKEFIEAMLRNK